MRSLYHCEDCHCPPPRHLTPPSVRTHHRRTSSRAAIITKEEDDIIPDDDLPSDLINLLENKSSNWDVRKRSLLARHVTGCRESVTALKSDVISGAKCEYVLVHNDSIRYHHLYMYFATRCSTVKELSKVTRHLFR